MTRVRHRLGCWHQAVSFARRAFGAACRGSRHRRDEALCQIPSMFSKLPAPRCSELPPAVALGSKPSDHAQRFSANVVECSDCGLGILELLAMIETTGDPT